MIKITVKPVESSKEKEFKIEPNSIISTKLLTDIPMDSDARARDISVGMVIKGRIIPGFVDTAGDSTIQLLNWSQKPAESVDAYRDVDVQMITAGVCEREYKFNKAFVVDYVESFKDESGTGIYEMTIRQKKSNVWDNKTCVIINGGFEAKEGK